MSYRDEVLEGLEWDNQSGNYKATEEAAFDYYLPGQENCDAWQDDNGQWWIDGDAVAEALEDADKRDAFEEKVTDFQKEQLVELLVRDGWTTLNAWEAANDADSWEIDPEDETRMRPNVIAGSEDY